MIAGGDANLFRHDLLRVRNVAPDVASRDIDVDISTEPAIFIADHAGAGLERDVRNLPQWDLGPGRRVDQHSLQRVDVAAEVTQVADIDRVPFAALDRSGYRLTANRRHQNVIGIIYGQSIPCQLIAFEVEVQKISACRPLSKHAGCTGDVFQRHLDLSTDFLNFAQVGAEHLDAERRAHTCGQHVDTRLDRHGPGIRDPRHGQRIVQTSGRIDQFLRGLVVRPEAAECAL